MREARWLAGVGFGCLFWICANGLRAVFYHLHSAPATDLENGIEIRWLAVEMHRKNSLRLRRDLRFNLCGVQIEGVRIDIGENWNAAEQTDAVSGSNIAESRYDHFVTGL